MAKVTYIGVGNTAEKVKKMYVGVNGIARKVKKAYIGVNGVAQICFASGLKFTYTGKFTLEGDPEKDWTLRLLTSGTLTFQSLPYPVRVWMNGAGGGSTRFGLGGGGGYIVDQIIEAEENVPYDIHIGQGVYQADGEATTAFGLTAPGGKKGYAETYGGHGGDGASGGGGNGGYNGGSTGGRGGSGGSNGAGTNSGTGSGISTREFGDGDALSAGGGGTSTRNSPGTGTVPYVSCVGGEKGGGYGGSGGDSQTGYVEYNGSNGAANTGSGGGANNTAGGSGRVSIRNVR